MIDLKKRETMKLAVASGALATFGSIAGYAVAAPVRESIGSEGNPNGSFGRGLGISDLQIDIYCRNSDSHYEVVLTNLTQKTLKVGHFKQGSVFWNGKYIDLNALRGNLGITVEANSFQQLYVRQQYRETSDVSQYVLADEAVENIEPGMRKVTLGAYLFEDQLYAYPVPVMEPAAESMADTFA